MLKSALVLAIAALALNSTRALWALMFLCTLAVGATLHVTAYESLSVAEAALTLLVLDLVGSLAYVVGVAVAE